jgi:NAD(P)-dependent dehydrogenase (short-subunit alcohol dehydrogenase family)
MPNKNRQKTILITGCNRGLGNALFNLYGNAGWNVIGTCRNPNAFSATCRRSGSVKILPLDLNNEHHFFRLTRELSNTPIDVIINNAAWATKEGNYASIQYTNWEKSMRINAYSILKMAESLLPNLLVSQEKKLIFISSVMGSINGNLEGGKYSYRCSKAAGNMIVKGLSEELKDDGIITASIHPGWVATRLGGPNAKITPAQSALYVKKIIDELTIENSGSFINYEGNHLEW